LNGKNQLVEYANRLIVSSIFLERDKRLAILSTKSL